MTNLRLLAAVFAPALLASACGPRFQAEDAGRLPDDMGTEQRQDQRDRIQLSDGATAQLRILETTDLHVNMEAFDYYKNAPSDDYGFVRTAAVIRKVRAEAKNSLLIDNGDLVQGSPLGDWFQKKRDPKIDLHSVYKALNLLNYDAANIGNHEFNYGVDFLQATLQGAKFPYVSANVRREDGKSFVLPYVLLTRTITADDGQKEDVTIGVIGFAPPQIMAWDRSNLLGRLKADDIVSTARAMVPEMRARGADIVIAVPHSGINAGPQQGNDENAVFYLAGVAGIDAILCGHSHQVFPSDTYKNLPETDLTKGLIKGVPTVMAGSWGSHVGVVDLSLKKVDGHWHVQDATAKALQAKKEAAGAVDQEVRDAIAPDHTATLSYLGLPVGTTDRAIQSYFSVLAPSSAVSVINDAQLWYGKKALDEGGDATASLRKLPLLSASAPLKASGLNGYTDVAAGALSLRNVADMYVYPNTVRIVKISGATLADWLEMAASAYNKINPALATDQQLQNQTFPAYNNDQIAGVSYEIDITQAQRFDKLGKVVNDTHRIVNLTYNGAPVDPAAEFLVVTNNYRANGGGQFPGLDGTNTVLDPGKESRDVLREYVESTPALSVTATRNWSLKPIPGAKVVFKTGTASPAYSRDVADLVDAAGTDADGYAVYRLKW